MKKGSCYNRNSLFENLMIMMNRVAAGQRLRKDEYHGENDRAEAGVAEN